MLMQKLAINKRSLLRILLGVYLFPFYLVFFSLSVTPADLPICGSMAILAVFGLVLAGRENRAWCIIWTVALIASIIFGVLAGVGGRNIARQRAESGFPTSPAYEEYPITADDKKFLAEVLEAVGKRDTPWLASHMVYPLSAGSSNQTHVVKTEKEFTPILAQELTDNIRTKIADDAKKNLFKNWQGVMVGEGILWFSDFGYPGSKDWKYGIFAIGNFAYQAEEPQLSCEDGNSASNTTAATLTATPRETLTVHGRLCYYNGTPSCRIWIVGTKRLLGVSEPFDSGGEKPAMPKKLQDMMSWDRKVFADFVVEPLSIYKQGEMQIVRVLSASKIIITDKKKIVLIKDKL